MVGRWIARLRYEWRKNDGKPWEQWEGGPDLQDRALRALAVVVGFVFMVLLVKQAWSH